MSCNCNNQTNNCCDIMDEILETIQSGMGQVDYDKIDEYIDAKIAELKAEIIGGDIHIEIDMDELIAKIRAALADNILEVDAYNVSYKGMTVGEKLDELTKEEFTGRMTNFRTFEKGEVLFNYRVDWAFNKPLEFLSIGLYVNDMLTGTFELDPEAKYFEIPRLAETTKVVVKGISKKGEVLILDSTAEFKLKYYVGCTGGKNIKNTEVLSLCSYFADKKVTEYSHIFNPMTRQYMWWIFPQDLHTDYDFFNNGFMDSNYEWKVANVTNAYGYTEPYIFICSGNPHTAKNIYVEVKAHEHK